MEDNLIKIIEERIEQLDKEYQARGCQNAPWHILVAMVDKTVAEEELRQTDSVLDFYHKCLDKE